MFLLKNNPERALQRSGYEVISAEDGAEALSVLACADPRRVTLVDWVMPRRTGIDVCLEVR